jgi:hypothetical protein
LLAVAWINSSNPVGVEETRKNPFELSTRAMLSAVVAADPDVPADLDPSPRSSRAVVADDRVLRTSEPAWPMTSCVDAEAK